MNCTFANRFFMFLCGTMLLTTGCDSNSDDADNSSGSDQITTLADLKALFEKGEITHIDFETEKMRELLGEEIESMTIIPNDDIYGFELMEIVTMSPVSSANIPDILRLRHTTSLTFSDEAEPVIDSEGNAAGYWSEIVVSIAGSEQADFTPRAHLFDSEITTPGLVLLGDKLQMKFTKK